VYGCIDGWL
jgi:TNF receptor-associated protein 1